MAIDLILGTAGHIDHGKTSLIRALTGAETDRLPEEKKRGITIELGYAELVVEPYHFGIVDVPGHEKFVRQMVSGATGMDVVMLIVAADDSVKQQTREHLEILRLLNIPAGLIALTKCDVIEPEWLDMVEDEIRQFVQGTFLESSPIVRTSAHTLEGIDDLKSEIVKAAEKADLAHQNQTESVPFRMAIDRCFALQGHGTVITGSVNSGQVKVGDQLNVEPGGGVARVRSLHNHAAAVDEIHRGQRAAINLGGIHHEDIHRGQEVCQPGYLVPTSTCTVELLLLPEARSLKNRAKLRFHVGTAEILGHIRFLDKEIVDAGVLKAGEKCFAQLFLSEPCVCVWGQPFVARSESPVSTIGGGRIIDPNALPISKPNHMDLEKVELLASREPRERVEANAYFGSMGDWDPAGLPRKTGVYDVQTQIDQLIADKTLIHIEISPTNSLLIHRESIGSLARNIENSIAKLHESNPLRWSFPIQEISKRFMYLAHDKLFNVALKQLQQEKKIRREHDLIGLEGYGPKLTKYEQQLLAEMIKSVKAGGVSPPSLKQLTQAATRNKERVPELLDLGCSNGQLVKTEDGVFFHSETIEEVKSMLRDPLKEGLTMSDIRQLIGTSRKFAVPLCEYFDRTGFTQRDGDVRRPGDSQMANSTSEN